MNNKNEHVDKEKAIKINNKDSSLLFLDKKLESFSERDLILNNNFKILKPEIKKIDKNSNFLSTLKSFMNNFESSNKSLLEDESLILKKNIENEDYNYNNSNSNKEEKFIELDLGLGIYDLIEKQNMKINRDINKKEDKILENVLNNKNAIEEPDLFLNENIIKFFFKNKKNKILKKKRIHFIKK